MKTDRILILGVGNLLLGDEGAGVHAINFLQKQKLPDHVDLLDGGTGGFHLLSLVNDYRKMILIDATIDGNSVGTVSLLKPKFSKDFPRALTTHDIGLKDLLDTATALEKLPEIFLITVSISPDQEVRMTLSDEIHRSLPGIASEVHNAINKLSI